MPQVSVDSKSQTRLLAIASGIIAVFSLLELFVVERIFRLSDAYYYMGLSDSLRGSGQLLDSVVHPPMGPVTFHNGVAFVMRALQSLGFSDAISLVEAVSLLSVLCILLCIRIFVRTLRSLGASTRMIHLSVVAFVLSIGAHSIFIRPINDPYFWILAMLSFYFLFQPKVSRRAALGLCFIAIFGIHFRPDILVLFAAVFFSSLLLKKGRLALGSVGLLLLCFLSLWMMTSVWEVNIGRSSAIGEKFFLRLFDEPGFAWRQVQEIFGLYLPDVFFRVSFIPQMMGLEPLVKSFGRFIYGVIALSLLACGGVGYLGYRAWKQQSFPFLFIPVFFFGLICFYLPFYGAGTRYFVILVPLFIYFLCFPWFSASLSKKILVVFIGIQAIACLGKYAYFSWDRAHRESFYLQARALQELPLKDLEVQVMGGRHHCRFTYFLTRQACGAPNREGELIFSDRLLELEGFKEQKLQLPNFKAYYLKY